MNNAKWWTIVSVTLILLVSGVTSVMAFMGHDMGLGMGRGDCQSVDGDDLPMKRKVAKMAKVYDLDESQQAQVLAIMTEHHEQVGRQRDEMQAVRQVVSAQNGATFEEQAVRQAAESSAGAYTEMMVSRARMQHDLYTVLTPEQRKLAEKLDMLSCNSGNGERGRRMHGVGMLPAGNMY